MTTVYINGRFAAQRQTGVQRYANETLRALDGLLSESSPGFSTCLLVPPGTEHPQLRSIEVREVGPLHGHLWEQLTLPWASRGGLLWSFTPTGPLSVTNQAVTIHDVTTLVMPHSYSWKFRAWYGVALPTLARRSRKVLAVSEFSRQEIGRCLHTDVSDVRVTGEGWQHVMRVASDPSIISEHQLTPGRYVLAVSSVTAHKNFAVVERALARLAGDYSVVIAGETQHAVFSSTRKASLDAVKLVGFVSDGALRALYENAGLFVFPSLYEGFGLPPLEAMAFGCPVLASRAASMPEVCGDGALYFEPHDDAQLATLIQRVMSNEDERRELVARGKARLAEHDWRRSARVHLAAMQEALGMQRTRPVRDARPAHPG
jgi:glycosyltransferase involved in cell wall biosynthesis